MLLGTGILAVSLAQLTMSPLRGMRREVKLEIISLSPSPQILLLLDRVTGGGLIQTIPTILNGSAAEAIGLFFTNKISLCSMMHRERGITLNQVMCAHARILMIPPEAVLLM